MEKQGGADRQTETERRGRQGPAGGGWVQAGRPLCDDERLAGGLGALRNLQRPELQGRKQSTVPPTHTHTAGYEAIFHFILLPPPPRSARPSPPSSSNTVRTRGRNTLSPCPGDSTPASQALLSLTPRMLSEPHDLWTLIFPERQSRPFLSSGLSGCLSPTHFSPSPPAPVF